VILTHGDDDGLRLPPAIAPRQVVIVPMLRGKPEDAAVLEYSERLAAELGAQTSFGERLRVLVDRKDIKSADKRWNWVRRGAPLILEIGPRDVAGGQVSFMRRDSLRDGDKVKSAGMPRDRFAAEAPRLLGDIQARLYAEAKARLDGNIVTGVKSVAELGEYFGAAAADDEDAGEFRGWVRAPWSRPSGPALDRIDEQLKALKLTIRNAPIAQQMAPGAKCLFTGANAVEEILIARAY
jgi:prolyl-tRNA synthetase